MFYPVKYKIAISSYTTDFKFPHTAIKTGFFIMHPTFKVLTKNIYIVIYLKPTKQ